MTNNNTILQGLRKVFLGATNVLLAFAGVACLAKGVWVLWVDESISVASAGLTAGLVLLLASSIERFEVLKGLGMEARTRKLDEAISQANATLDQLRELAVSISGVTITELMASNFFGGSTLKTRLSLHDNLLATLKNLGVSDSQIEKADHNWRKGIGVICHRILRQKLPQKGDVASEFDTLLNFEEWAAPSAAQLEKFINARNMMTSELQQWIDDYRHFLSTGEIRRVELFSAG